jgi:hypothetical protein
MLNRATPPNPIDIPIVVTGGGGKSAIVALSLTSEDCGVVVLYIV